MAVAFLIVLPIALVMLLIGIKYVENVGETSRSRIDVLTVALSAFGFGGLVYGLTLSGESRGSGPVRRCGFRWRSGSSR